MPCAVSNQLDTLACRITGRSHGFTCRSTPVSGVGHGASVDLHTPSLHITQYREEAKTTHECTRFQSFTCDYHMLAYRSCNLTVLFSVVSMGTSCESLFPSASLPKETKLRIPACSELLEQYVERTMRLKHGLHSS